MENEILQQILTEIGSIKTDVGLIKSGQDRMQSDIDTLKSDVQTVKQDVIELRDLSQAAFDDILRLDDRITAVK